MNNEDMRTEHSRLAIVTLAMLAVLAGCGPSKDPEPKATETSSSSPREDTCIEVRAGVASYNAQDLDSVQPHFVRAEVFARKYAKQSSGKEADDLLEAVRFFAKVPPSGYSKDAASMKLFEKYKAITLGDCLNGDQDNSGDEAPGQKT